MTELDVPPIAGACLLRAVPDDAAEILVLQRCCWVDEALANETLEIAPLYESLDVVRAWIAEWAVWCVRDGARLIGGVRARRAPGDDTVWEIGRLMVAPDQSGRGLGRWLLGVAESAAPDDIATYSLYTGARSERNQRMYQRAGYVLSTDPAPPSAVMLYKPARRSAGQ